MSRVADATIKGFLYQFNLTLINILNSSSEDEIQVEGIIEDIDIISENEITAIQCKYHESCEEYTLSAIYKPVLQMLKNYCQNSKSSNIKYVLYAYFPSLSEGIQVLSKDDLLSILNTTNIELICNYICYIKPPSDPVINSLVDKSSKSKVDKEKIKDYYIKNSIEVGCDLDNFLNDSFTFTVGKSFLDLEAEIKSLLINNDFSKDDVKDLIYPNAIQTIAELSIKKDDMQRKISKRRLLSNLRKIKTTAITRWTKELSDYKSYLKARRKQLSANLNINLRKRCIIFNSPDIIDFDDEIVAFIKDYIDNYCCKIILHTPAVFCICDYDKSKIDALITRLFKNGINVENGYRGIEFFKEAFVRDPEKKINDGWMEFILKLCGGTENIYEILNQHKPDDIFYIGDISPREISTEDVNYEHIDVRNFEELRYLLKMGEGI